MEPVAKPILVPQLLPGKPVPIQGEPVFNVKSGGFAVGFRNNGFVVLSFAPFVILNHPDLLF
jgi:hypothetical protein